MKKHILGFAIFSLIVAAFALVYTFFYVPAIPSKETVKPPVSQTETRQERPYTCQLKRNKLNYEVLSSEFDLDENRLTSKVRVTWNGYGEPPDQIYAKTELFTLDQKEFSQTIDPISFTEVFKNRREATLIVISKLEKTNKKIDEQQNLYVNFNFSESYPSENYSKPSNNLAEAHQVLFVHGESSVVRNTIPLKIKN